MATEVRIDISGAEKAQNAFQKIADAEKQRNTVFRDMNASYQRLSTNVNGLNGQLRALTEARDRSFNPVAIERFNAKIAETQKKIAELRSKGATPNLPTLSPAKAQVGELSALTSGLGRAVLGAFAVSKVLEFGSAVFDTTRRMQSLETSIKFVSKTEVEFQKNMSFLRETANKLGLDLESAARGFKTIAGAALPAGISSDGVRKTFESVAKASTAMGLSAEETEGIFLALGQMISKGTVQAEELRGQLGERLPGAFNLAAQSMGVTTAQLNKMLEQGQVATKDFLPKFANELDKVYSAGAQMGSDGLNANLNRFYSSLTNLYKTVGDFLTPAFNEFLKILTVSTNRFASWFSDNKNIEVSTQSIIKKVKEEQTELGVLVGQIRTQNLTNEARSVLLSELSKKFPDFAKSIDVATASEQELAKAIQNTNKKIEMQAFGIAKKEITDDIQKQINQIGEEQASAVKKIRKAELEGDTFTSEFYKKRVNELKGFIAQIEFQQEQRIAMLRQDFINAGIDVDNANEEMIGGKKEFSEKEIEIQRKALEEQAKQRAEFEVRELEAAQKLAVLILENKIKNNAELLNQENLAYAEKTGVIRKGQELELELIQLKNKQAKEQYEVGKSNAVQTKKQTESELKAIDEQARQEEIDLANKTKNKLKELEVKPLQSRVAANKDFQAQMVKNAEKAFEKLEQLREDKDKKELDRLKQKEETKKSIMQASEQALNEIVDFGFDRKADRLQGELDSLQKQRDYELALAGENEAKKVAINQNFAEKERQIKQRQAQAEKQRAIFEILLQTGINTVKAIGSAPFPANLPAIALATGSGIIQLALASARPLPKFNKGTKYVQLNGNPDGVDTVPALLNKGERIVPTAINAKMMGVANEALPALIALGLQASLPAQDKGIGKEVLVDALKEVFRGLPTDKVVFDKNGFAHYTETARQSIKNLNADYGI